MDFEAGVDAVFLEGVEDRTPAARQLVERRLDEAGRPLRPGIDVGPRQGAGEGSVLGKPEPARRARRTLDLLDRPRGPRGGVAADFGRGERIERGVVRGMHGHQLALQVRGQLGDLEAALGEDALHLVTVGLALGRRGEVEQPGVPGGDLDALEAQPRGPTGDGVQVIERRRIARELRQEYGRPLDRPHRASSREQMTTCGERKIDAESGSFATTGARPRAVILSREPGYRWAGPPADAADASRPRRHPGSPRCWGSPTHRR